MDVRPAFVLLFVLAAACGGSADAGAGTDDYFAKLQRVSETAHIQERGLRRDLLVRLEEAGPGEDRMTVVTVFVDQSARLYQDVVNALRDLDPPDELVAPQRAYLEAWQGQLELMVAVRDAGFPGPQPIVEALGRPAFLDAAEETEARCADLQAAVAAAGSDVDLVCDGRPS